MVTNWTEHKEEIEILATKALYLPRSRKHTLELLEKHYGIFGKFQDCRHYGPSFKAYDANGRLIIETV